MVRIEELLAVVVRPAAWSWMQQRYLQSGPVCPACAEAITGPRALAAWQDLRRVYCAACGHTFRPTAGTPIHETSWQPEEFVQLLLLVEAGRQPTQIATQLGKSTACIRDMIERIQVRHQVAGGSASVIPCEAPTAQG